jgi:serine/threonine protein kinase
MPRLHLRTSGHSSAGDAQRPNDDAWIVRELNDGTLLAAVADGVGSARGGGEAARRALEMLGDYFGARPSAWTPRRALLAFVRQINRQLYQESAARFETPELVTTLSGIVVAGSRVYGVSVGDSPVWHLRHGTLSLLTQAHTSAEPGEEHVLTQAVGLAEDLIAHVFELELEVGDQLLLCTDGVSQPLEREGLLRQLERAAAARSIVTAAREATAPEEVPDDSTAVLLEVIGRDDDVVIGQTLQVVSELAPGDVFPDGKLVRPLDATARVWLAETPAGSHVLLKFPPPEAAQDEARAEGFLREAWQAARLDAPEFVRSRVPSDPALRYYIQDYINAPTLTDVLRERQTLPVEAVIALGEFLTRAAQSLAARDLAHGDLKPDNLLVIREDPSWEFRLIDFGSAAELFSVTSRAGTPSYLAPERFQGAALSERTEIFTIGVILYQCLTGRLPFGEIERFQSPRFAAAPKPAAALNSATPAWLDCVLQRMLVVSPAERYAHYSEVAHDLRNPQAVRPFHRAGAPLLERNPLLFYKVLCLVLLGLNILQLLWRPLSRG